MRANSSPVKIFAMEPSSPPIDGYEEDERVYSSAQRTEMETQIFALKRRVKEMGEELHKESTYRGAIEKRMLQMTDRHAVELSMVSYTYLSCLYLFIESPISPSYTFARSLCLYTFLVASSISLLIYLIHSLCLSVYLSNCIVHLFAYDSLSLSLPLCVPVCLSHCIVLCLF